MTMAVVILGLLTASLRSSLTAPSSTIEGILTSIVRKPGLPDAIFPTVCPPACEDLFHAEEGSLNATLSDKCSCVCPRGAPIYLNTAGYCVEKLDECRHNIAFNSSIESERHLPVVSLPARNGVVHPKVPILWRESGITVSSSGSVNCSVTGVFFDNIEHRWRGTNKRALFDIDTLNGRSVIMLRGSEGDVSSLIGSVVQLKVSCARFMPDEHCLSFRVAGVSGANPYHLPSGRTRAEIFFILILLVLLALSLIGSFVVWHMCWRIKKRQLISDIQMQFLYHFKQQQEAHKLAAAQLAASEMVHISPSEFGPTRERMLIHSSRRRPVVNAQFLEMEIKDMMQNPSPSVEQFLFDVHRYIESSRERIRVKRFVPMLITIPEEFEESLHSTILDVTPDEAENSVMSQESPRSEAKSIDSGRESKEDSDDSSRDGEEDESAEEQNNVRNIVNGFESRLAHPSQLPVSGSCSPRFIPPTNVIRPASSQIPILLGQSSPRPVQRTLALPRASSVSNSSTLMEYSDKRSRKSYTIFPADPMLNKSLTRRPKRAIPRPVVHAE